MPVEIGLGQHQGHALLLGPLDGQLLAALGAGGGQRHVRPLGLGPVQGVEDAPRVVGGVGLGGRPEGHDDRARGRVAACLRALADRIASRASIWAAVVREAFTEPFQGLQTSPVEVV